MFPTINLLAINFSFANAEIKFLHKTWLHCIDLATGIDECYDQILAKLYYVPDTLNPLKLRLANHEIYIRISHSHQRGDCRD